ncbi:hypothetical protein Tco_0680317 [Tanacetum coccineum]|uniref:Uncharacterized protein n=1 Tax=Tanacetum coccineum TaxID=301880 RepID=A0ABQ4XLC1_9ASTR
MGFIVYQMGDVGKSAISLWARLMKSGSVWVTQAPRAGMLPYPLSCEEWIQKRDNWNKTLFLEDEFNRESSLSSWAYKSNRNQRKPLVKDEEASDVEVNLYRSMIGLLNVFVTALGKPNGPVGILKCLHLTWNPTQIVLCRANLDRKSTTGGCQFLGRRLITWQCKKQTIMATSTTEAEYVAAASCCGQVLWIQNQMLDYGFNFMNTKIYIDNESTICIVKNPVYHSKTKHIAIRHHFIRDAYEKKLIQVLKIHTNDNVADLLTKAFDVSRFQFLVVSIGWGHLWMERGKTHHGKSNLFQETPKPLCSTFLPTDVKHCLNVGYTFVNFATSEAVCDNSCLQFQEESKNSLVKHFEDMRLYRPPKEYLLVWFDPPRDMSMSCLTTKGMRNNGAMCARRFRESLRRVTNGAEAFLILTLFILCLDKVSTDHAKLVPLGKVCTAKETLEKNTAKGRKLANISVPLDHFPVNSLTSKVFSFMIKKGKHFSGKVTPLFDTMLVQPTQDEGASSERLSDEQPSPSPTPTGEVPNEPLPDSSSTQPSKDSQGRASHKKHRVHKESVSKQGRKKAKGESSVQRDPLFDVMPEDKIDHMEKENAQSEGRTREMVDEDKEFDEDRLISTDGSKVSTNKRVEGTEENNEGTEEIFEGTEEQREEEIEEEEESESEDDDIPQAVKKFKTLGLWRVMKKMARENSRRMGKRGRMNRKKQDC